jgi:hypothetical protein
MAVSITGSKYGDVALSAVGTTTVTVGSGTFSSGDFDALTPRLAALYASGGSFKGVAYVRRYVSATQLELETVFFNPSTGAAATQASGDIVHVSKNWAEVATTGIAVSDVFVTVSDFVTFGTNGDDRSVCFYDEGKHVTFNFSPVAATAFTMAGGLVVQGHLADYGARTVYNGCTWRINGSSAASFSIVSATSTSAKFLFFGGTITNYASSTNYGYICGVNGWTTSDFQRFLCMRVTVIDLDMLAGDGGVNFSNPLDHIVDSCVMVTSRVQYSILMRWANGIANANTFKIANYSDKPLSIFGGDVDGTEVGSAADGRVIVSDIGDGNALWRRGTDAAPMVTIKVKNIITTNKQAIAGLSGASNNCTLNFFYRDTFTNLQADTTGVLSRDGDSTIVDSVVGTGASWAPELQHDSWTGTTQNSGWPKGPWTYSFKAYGFAPVSSAITAGTYDLGTPGIADNVTFGGPIIQLADSSITLSKAAANALTSIATLDNLYDVSMAWSVASATNAQYPTLGTYIASADGSTLDVGDRNVVVDGTAGAAFAVNAGTDTITIKASTLSAGTKFVALRTTGTISFTNGAAASATLVYVSSAGTSVPLTVACRNGSKVRVVRTDTDAEIAIGTAGASGFVSRLTWTTDLPIRADVAYAVGVDAELEASASGTLTNLGAALVVTQAPCTVYETNAIDGTTVTGLTLDGINVECDADEVDNELTCPEFFAWYKTQLMTDTGIRKIFRAVVAANSATYEVDVTKADLKIHNIDVVNTLMITNGVISCSDGSSIRKAGPTATHGSIEMVPDRVYTIETGVSGLTAPEAAQLASIVDVKAKTDNLPANPAAVGDIPTAVQIRQEIDTNSTKLLAIVPNTALIPATV